MRGNSLIAAMAKWGRWCCWGYAAALLGVLGILWGFGDRWWFATVLLYGPRWIYALPLIVLIPAALLWRRRILWLLGICVLVVFGPIMGFNLPQHWTGAPEEGPMLRVATYNIHRWEVTSEEFAKFLDEVKPDIVAIQECAPSRWKPPAPWYVLRAGESLVVSRYPIVSMERISTRKPDTNGLYCVVETPFGPVGFCCIDLLTPRRALTTVLDRDTVFNLSQAGYAQDRIARRWQESEELAMWLGLFPSPMIMAGDFNLTVDSPIYRKAWAGFRNAFSRTGLGYGHTKKTKINIFRYKTRIDHILSTPEFTPVRCWVGPDYGSDHLPLVADLVFGGKGKSTEH